MAKTQRDLDQAQLDAQIAVAGLIQQLAEGLTKRAGTEPLNTLIHGGVTALAQLVAAANEGQAAVFGGIEEDVGETA